MPVKGVPVRPETLKTKVCLIGEQAVGKTSLIHRFVSGAFDETYIRTLGAAASKKVLEFASIGGRPVHMDMTILDIMGKRTFLELFQESYFYQAQGVLAVADLTRRQTLDSLAAWISGVKSAAGELPVVIVVNKADLGDRAEYGRNEIEEVAKASRADFFLTSAKTGDSVEDAFRKLGGMAAERQLRSP